MTRILKADEDGTLCLPLRPQGMTGCAMRLGRDVKACPDLRAIAAQLQAALSRQGGGPPR